MTLKQHCRDFIFGEDTQVVIACNTAHLLREELEDHMQHKISSLINASLDEISKRKLRSVVLLASPTTISSGLYEKPLSEAGIEVVLASDEQQKLTESIIRQAIANKPLDALRDKLTKVIGDLESDAQCVLLGCTELSLIYGVTKNPSVIDPMSLVVEEMFRKD